MGRVQFEAAVDPFSYLLRLAASPHGRAYKAVALAYLDLRPGGTVLDLGCGPGADLGALAEIVGPGGTVVGIDHDDDALGRARHSTRGLPQVEVRTGDLQALDIVDETADAVRTDRVLQHVLDPAEAIAEATRVLKIGGRAVFVEPDWHTLVSTTPSPVSPRPTPAT